MILGVLPSSESSRPEVRMDDGPLQDPAGLLDRRLIEVDFHSEFEMCRGRLCSDVPATAL
jgi:hypothetical protein